MQEIDRVRIQNFYFDTMLNNHLFQKFKLTKINRQDYLVEWPCIAKDEINGTLDIAVFEVMAAFIVMKGILGSEESTTPECSLISRYSYCHCLGSNITRAWNRSYILAWSQRFWNIVIIN
jgi:hypothetical protein